MVNGRRDSDNVADGADNADVKPSPLGACVDHRHGQAQIPLTMPPEIDRKAAEILSVVLAKLLDPFALINVPLLVRMNRQFDHPVFQQAKLEIEAGGVFFSVIPDQA